MRCSQRGSGSSIRSFGGPWILWDGEIASSPVLPYSELIHQVIIVQGYPKTVSSSEAHIRVRTSPHFIGRARRAVTRCKELLKALQAQDWSQVYGITKEEYEDMHNLFHTSTPSFSYLNPQTHAVLADLHSEWNIDGDGPLVTMDAGPNIHVLYRLEKAALAREHKKRYEDMGYDVL